MTAKPEKVHPSQEQLLDRIRQAREKVAFAGHYIHYKQPDQVYEVQGFVIIEATDSVGVLYQAQYGERLTFVRPLSSWLAEVEWHGKKVPRFKLVPGTDTPV